MVSAAKQGYHCWSVSLHILLTVLVVFNFSWTVRVHFIRNEIECDRKFRAITYTYVYIHSYLNAYCYNPRLVHFFTAKALLKTYFEQLAILITVCLCVVMNTQMVRTCTGATGEIEGGKTRLEVRFFWRRILGYCLQSWGWCCHLQTLLLFNDLEKAHWFCNTQHQKHYNHVVDLLTMLSNSLLIRCCWKKMLFVIACVF